MREGAKCHNLGRYAVQEQLSMQLTVASPILAAESTKHFCSICKTYS